MLARTFRILVFSLIVFVGNVYGQENARGYIAISAGPNFLFGESNPDFEPGVGLNLTLANFGYTLGKGFGIAVIWAGGAHKSQSTTIMDGVYGKAYWRVGYGMFMFGPQYTFRLSDRSALDLKARIGSFYAREEITMNIFELNSEKFSLGYSLGATYRYSFAKRWCAILSCDYSSGDTDGLVTYEKRMLAISTNAGIGFQFLK